MKNFNKIFSIIPTLFMCFSCDNSVVKYEACTFYDKITVDNLISFSVSYSPSFKMAYNIVSYYFTAESTSLKKVVQNFKSALNELKIHNNEEANYDTDSSAVYTFKTRESTYFLKNHNGVFSFGNDETTKYDLIFDPVIVSCENLSYQSFNYIFSGNATANSFGVEIECDKDYFDKFHFIIDNGLSNKYCEESNQLILSDGVSIKLIDNSHFQLFDDCYTLVDGSSFESLFGKIVNKNNTAKVYICKDGVTVFTFNFDKNALIKNKSLLKTIQNKVNSEIKVLYTDKTKNILFSEQSIIEDTTLYI